MIKIRDLIKEYIEYRLLKVGIGSYLHNVDFNKIKSELDKLKYIGRFSNEDMIPNEDYVIIKSDRAIRLYSKRIQNDSKVYKLLIKYKMTPWGRG